MMIYSIIGVLALVAAATCVNRGSLTFVIDDTLSMGPTILEVKKASLKIMDIVFSKPTTPIEDIVLVTFNDPTTEFKAKTRDKMQLEAALNAIRVHNFKNEYCPEYSLSGLELGLLKGHNNSFVFLFTDAAACDIHKLNPVINIAQEKQTQVNFVITPSHCNVEIVDNYLYYDIAAQTNGQIFHLQSTSEIQDLFKYVDTVIAGERTVIVSEVIPAGKHVEVPFTVDDQTEYVVVSASGKNVQLDVKGPVNEFEKLTWTANIKMVKINNPVPGDYFAKVFGSSSTSIMVFGRTDFTFEHGFSTVPATSLNDADKQPIDGSTYYLLISVKDPSHSVKINNVILQTMDGRTLTTLPLKKVTGVGIITNRPIRRKSKTPVIIRKQDIKPRVTVDKTTVSIDYDDEVALVCNVKAHPKPTIEWFFESNAKIPLNQNMYKANTYDYTSSMRLASIKRSQRFRCSAKNIFGTTSQDCSVVVRSPFVARDEPFDRNTYINYGKSGTINCDIKSRFNMQISWFKETSLNKFEPIINSTKFIISSDQTKLTIHSVDEISRGKYTCKAFIIGDEDTNHVLSRNVSIMKVAPVLSVDKDVIVVPDHFPEIRVKCNILDGYPRPTFAWMFRSDSGDLSYLTEESSNVLTIKDTNKAAGNYTCIAKNVVGTVSQSVKVFVQAPPKILKDNPLKTGVEGDAALRLPCTVTGYPKPSIIWTVDGFEIKSDGKKYLIVDGALVIMNPLESDNKNYTCEATNEIGTYRTTFETYITPTIEHDEDRGDEEYIYILKGDTKKLTCGKGEPINHHEKVVWYKENQFFKTSKTITINNAKFYDDGNYTCRASSVDKVITHTYVVDVGTAPVFQYKLDTNVEWDGDYEQLQCIVTMKPEIKTTKIMWIYNGKVLNTTLQTQDIIGWGNYTCKISNVHGKVERNFSVYSSVCLIRRDVANTNMPVIFNKDSTWPKFETMRDYFVLAPETELKLSCNSQAERQNSFNSFPGKHEIVAFCNREDKFTVFGDEIYKFDDLFCERPVLPSFQATGEKCLQNNTELIKVGFGSDSFIEAYRVCFDKINHIPLYTYVEMSTPINLAGKVADHHWRNYIWTPDDSQYNCTEYEQNACYSRAQLVNAQDVKFGPPQTATYYNRLNSVPLWHRNSATEVTWDEVEMAVRVILSDIGAIRVWTGAISQYSPRDDKNLPTIEEQPRYLWKVVKSEELTFAVVRLNSWFWTYDDVLCYGTCPVDFPSSTYTFCCEVSDFSIAFDIPLSVFDKP